MTIPTINIGMSSISNEFGGSGQRSLSQYYRGGAYVPSQNTTIPASGQISFSNFSGVTKYTPPPPSSNSITDISFAGTTGGISNSDHLNLYVSIVLQDVVGANYTVYYYYSRDNISYTTAGLNNTSQTIYSGNSTTSPLLLYTNNTNSTYWNPFYIKADIPSLGISRVESYGPIWV